nr:olfactory receptor 1030-like [Pelodiscus sinensis]|eukprot:XP_006133469.1 olfactory receptor 1030-like [Pelodiscus sinensis]
MEKRRNQTPITEFVLLGFGNGPELQPLLFPLFLMIYFATVAGNILIVLLVAVDRHLHTPMYYLLGNLSCLETCYASTILPRLLASLLTRDRTISVKGCLVQLCIFGNIAAIENLLLTAMSYDRCPVGQSYLCIITTILRIPSTKERQKAFSTCSSHLIMVIIVYVTLIAVYVAPTTNTPKVLHKIFSVFYSVLTPLINPIIYSLRNKEVKESLRKALLKLAAVRNRHRR